MRVPADRRVPRPLVVALLTLAPLAGAWTGWLAGRRGPPDLSAHREAIDRAAAVHGLDAALLAALVAAESGGRPKARSPRGARGLLQLMPETAAWQARRLGEAPPEDLDDPETNLRLGAAYLAWLLARFEGEEAFALAAYNAGPTPVERWRTRAPDASPHEVIQREGYAETRRHVRRVLAWRERYRGEACASAAPTQGPAGRRLEDGALHEAGDGPASGSR